MLSYLFVLKWTCAFAIKKEEEEEEKQTLMSPGLLLEYLFRSHENSCHFVYNDFLVHEKCLKIACKNKLLIKSSFQILYL